MTNKLAHEGMSLDRLKMGWGDVFGHPFNFSQHFILLCVVIHPYPSGMEWF